MIIKILGIGCSNCIRLEENTRTALKNLGLTAEIVKVKDMVDIATYGIMRTPGLVIDEKVVSYGKVLNVQEVMALLNKPGQIKLESNRSLL
ncbi:MAG: redox-active disulfide protein 2 [Erysipelotrichaceae bacterium]|nr:MAG: redox-active disulfide protein [Erysipelotrichaceae bacterium]TXT18075.1 MAG: redox-active disulfide protein 2 [Erysipelotrichaceae bacterium]